MLFYNIKATTSPKGRAVNHGVELTNVFLCSFLVRTCSLVLSLNNQKKENKC